MFEARKGIDNQKYLRHLKATRFGHYLKKIYLGFREYAQSTKKIINGAFLSSSSHQGALQFFLMININIFVFLKFFHFIMMSK
jgi:hypothetical protein